MGYTKSTLLGVSAFGALFLTLAFVLHPLVRRFIEKWPSSDKTESTASWFAWHVQSVIHATTVSTMAWLGIRRLYFSSAAEQFQTPQLGSPELQAIALIANASHIFFCFLVVDTIVTFARKAMTIDYFLHHVVFCSFCLLIQYDCFAPFLAGCLLLMEISTIFLNGFSFLRHRLGYEHWLVKFFFVAFGGSFFVFRLLLTTYVAIRFSSTVFRGEVDFDKIPSWRLYFICAALVAAVCIQFFWASSITKKLIRMLGEQQAPRTKKEANGKST